MTTPSRLQAHMLSCRGRVGKNNANVLEVYKCKQLVKYKSYALPTIPIDTEIASDFRVPSQGDNEVVQILYLWPFDYRNVSNAQSR